MHIEVNRHEDVLVIRPSEARIDAAVAAAFQARLRQEADGHEGRLVLDLSAVEFMDSSGLGVIVATHKHVIACGGLTLAAPRDAVVRLLKLARLDRIMTVASELDDALISRS